MRPLALTCLLCASPACYPEILNPVLADAPFDADVQPIDGSADAPIDTAPPIDAPIDSSPDTDGDGKPDVQDNCPEISNADQNDHDGDRRGDVCDGCPHIAELDPTDDDGDGIGDACDPHRNDNQDVIEHFDGFYNDGPGLPSGFEAPGDQAALWKVENGKLMPTTADGIRLVSWTGKQLRDQVVDTQMTVLAIGNPNIPNPGNNNVGVVAGHAPDMDGSGPLWLCTLLDDNLMDDNGPILQLAQLGSRGTKDSAPLPIKLEKDLTQSYRIELKNSSSPDKVDQTCALSFDPTTLPQLMDSDPINSDGFAGLRTRGVQAAFDYIVIYGRKP